MSFPSKTRGWWKRVMPKCQCLVWNGLTYEVCNEPTAHIHHIIPEKWSLYQLNSKNPHDVLALGLCKKHHVGMGRGKFGSWDFSMHPDYGYALNYWKQNPTLMSKVHDRHIELAKKGEPYWNNEGDDAYLELSQQNVLKHEKEFPEDKKPVEEYEILHISSTVQ